MSHSPGAFEPAYVEMLALKSVDLAERAVAQSMGGGHPWSLLFGEAGATVACALSTDLASRVVSNSEKQSLLRNKTKAYVGSYLKICPRAVSMECQEDEILYGRAGYLLGLLILRANIGQNIEIDCHIRSVAAAILQRGYESAIRCPSALEAGTKLWWEWHGSPYLGAAHGSIGACFSKDHSISRSLCKMEYEGRHTYLCASNYLCQVGTHHQ